MEERWASLAALSPPQFEPRAHAHNCMVAAAEHVSCVDALRAFFSALENQGFSCQLCEGDGSFELEGVHHGVAPVLRVRVGAFAHGKGGSIVAMRRLYGDEDDVFDLFDTLCAAFGGDFHPISNDDTGNGEAMLFYDGSTATGRVAGSSAAARSASPSFDEIDWGFSGASSASLSSSLPSETGMDTAGAGACGPVTAPGAAASVMTSSVSDDVRSMLDTAVRGWPDSPHQAASVRASALEWLAHMATRSDGPEILRDAGAPEHLTRILELESSVLELCHPALVCLLHISCNASCQSLCRELIDRAGKAVPALFAEMPASLVAQATQR